MEILANIHLDTMSLTLHQDMEWEEFSEQIQYEIIQAVKSGSQVYQVDPHEDLWPEISGWVHGVWQRLRHKP